ERELDVNVQALRLEGGEAVGDRQEFLAHGGQMVQALLQPEIGQIVGADLIAQEDGELLVLLHEGVFEIGAEDVMPVLDLFQRGVEFALQLLGDADAEDLADPVRGQPPQPNLAGAFEDAVNGEVALEDEIDAILASPLHAAQTGPNVIFLPDAFLGPLHGDLVNAGERLHPSPILAGSFAQHRLVHHGNPDHVAEKVDYLFRARQPAQISMDDDAVETVVYKNQ